MSWHRTAENDNFSRYCRVGPRDARPGDESVPQIRETLERRALKVGFLFPLIVYDLAYNPSYFMKTFFNKNSYNIAQNPHFFSIKNK